jgi:hypothetical protein
MDKLNLNPEQTTILESALRELYDDAYVDGYEAQGCANIRLREASVSDIINKYVITI